MKRGKNKMTMAYEQIHKFILENGHSELQVMIDNGNAWKLEGFAGRSAMDALKVGACILTETPSSDYYGNRIPSYTEVAPGSIGSLELAIKFYKEVL
jgi:hypothetical protein